jgi:hypothetical protein
LLAIPLSPGATYGSVAQHINGTPLECLAVRAIAMAFSGFKKACLADNICGTTGTGFVGAELQPITRPATNNVNIIIIVRVFIGHSLHILGFDD